MMMGSIFKSFGNNIIYGSSNKNPLKAVKEILNTLKGSGRVFITPDGPRGPAMCINGDILRIANKANACIIPFSAKCDRYISLKSWDKMIIPYPFNKIDIYFADPIESSNNDDSLTRSALLIQGLSVK
jgi:lysophospholipid acyltransferase (LPLAT)-like uncharacterized protein